MGRDVNSTEKNAMGDCMALFLLVSYTDAIELHVSFDRQTWEHFLQKNEQI